jgi:signal peptidase I
MYPTYKQGDRLILNRISVHLGADFERGEVITFEAPSSEYQSLAQIDQENPVAIYNKQPKNLISKFFYYVLDINKKSYIKRVIGLPEEHIQIENGNVYVEGMLLTEDYLQSGVTTTSTVLTDFTVPEGYLFVMGDNRPDSMDSREFGCIPISKVEGKVWIRFWKAKG